MVAGANVGDFQERPRATIHSPVAENAGPRQEVHRGTAVAVFRVEIHFVTAARAVVGHLRAEERDAVFCRRRLPAFPEHLLVQLRELRVFLVFGQRQEQAARLQNVIALFEHIELQLAVGVRPGGQDDRLKLLR